MPEYLAPGVYVEEVSTGSKPIEGVSTSTAGMVGVTERGPENVPILITSTGEFRRVFGGELRLADFTDNTGRIHGYLPHSVQGFFQNDGRRNYVVRVLPENATPAARLLFDRGDSGSVETQLLRVAPQESGTLVNQPLLYAIDNGAMVAGDWIRVGEGSRAEYRELANSTAATVHVALSFPLSLSYPETISIAPLVRAAVGAAYTLVNAAARGARSVVLQATGNAHATALIVPATPPFLEFGDAGVAEYLPQDTAILLPGFQVRVNLLTPLQMDYEAGDNVSLIDISAPEPDTTLALAANAGEALVYPADIAIATSYPLATPSENQLILIDDSGGTGNVEVRRLGNFGELTLDIGAYEDYPAASRIERVILAYDSQIVAVAPAPAAQTFSFVATGNLTAGMTIEVQGNANLATIQTIVWNTITLTADITLTAALAAAPVAGDSVTIATRLNAQASRGSIVLSLANRLGLEVGDVLRVGTAPNEEYITITRITGTRGVAPDAGTVVIASPLRETYAASTIVVHVVALQADRTQPAAFSILPTLTGNSAIYVNDNGSYLVAPNGFRANDIVRISTSNGTVSYHRLAADAADTATRTIELDDALAFSHDAGNPLVEREALISVQSIDRGAWGNRLQIAVEDEPTGLVQAALTGINPPQVISLSNFTGVEAGTILELVDPDTELVVGDPLKVVAVDRASGEVELDGTGLSAAHIAAHNLAQMAGLNLRVRSREFAISIFLLQRPDPAVPSRNNTVIDSERFVVSLDPRHSRYLHNVIGTTWVTGSETDDDGNPLRLWDQRSEGESAYIRVRDLAVGNQPEQERVRPGPEALVDVLDSGQLRAARLPLDGGDDAILTLINSAQADIIYLGVDSDEPRLRTGIHALRNITDIAIVAVPGQTTVGVQQALINHCENDRYRFAVLDAQGPNRDTLADVQAQRQNFDSKYAAIYHPWLTIPEPLPANVVNIRPLAIPPSGHIIGVYARTDNTRGVHKAPANEVVRGITGLTRKLNQRERDILNPFPKNINVVRDFRDANRGLRVWGARCITSDSEYKYVNVRRLMIFLEASIDQGLQWVVFEPNAEPLWARVRRSITNFLNVVWRNGALEGTTPEQAFFVKCDRTTMTQTDIDSGRLICVIGVAPVKPAEFVIVRIGLWTASAD
jgi:phage tail sheath protein FI